VQVTYCAVKDVTFLAFFASCCVLIEQKLSSITPSPKISGRYLVGGETRIKVMATPADSAVLGRRRRNCERVCGYELSVRFLKRSKLKIVNVKIFNARVDSIYLVAAVPLTSTVHDGKCWRKSTVDSF
jgi:hypothetical protein